MNELQASMKPQTISRICEAINPADAKKFLQMLKSEGVKNFSGFGISVELYPDASFKNPTLEMPEIDAKQSAREAIEAAKRAIDEEDKNLLWST